ncbi:hypothetical protein ACTVZO_45290 [Streptomyces sp. IBSNAI002]|uniref:hypothetical protein n=1 Tax=Streptomyces sp. IBSNAI002 TaxID=3457500 RepID=UPI003FD1F76D
MWNLRKKRKEKRQMVIHFAKRVIFATDAAINSGVWEGEVTTLDVQDKARQLFNLELSDKAATFALLNRLEERGFLVSTNTVRSMDA